MAQTLQQIRAKTRTSIHGRQLGIAGDLLHGVKAIRKVVTDITTAGSVLPNHGFVTMSTSSNAVACTLASPETGVGVDIATIGKGTATTGTWVITSASTAATFTSSAGTGKTKITMKNTGANVSLMGISTAIWVLLSGQSTAYDALAS